MKNKLFKHKKKKIKNNLLFRVGYVKSMYPKDDSFQNIKVEQYLLNN